MKNIFTIANSLTEHLYSAWGFTASTWFTPARYYWVIFDGTDWIGYGCASVQNRTTLYIGPTYIKSEYRGNGLQIKLIKIREKFAKKNGFSYLISSVNYDNLVSSNNLKKLGFKKCKPWNNIKATGLYFKKRI